MSEQRYARRCLLVCVAALLAATAVYAASRNPAGKTPAAKTATKSAAPQDITSSISLNRLAGRWKGATSGLEISIVQGSIGWEAWLSVSGQARITQPEADPQVIKIQSRNFTCTYTVTLPTAQTMKWELAPSQPSASQCLGDTFTKVGLAPQGMRPGAAARPGAPAKPPVGTEKRL